MAVLFPAPRKRIILAAGDLSCEIWPEVGGGIARFSQSGAKVFHILRPAPEQSSYVTNDLGCWPLVPFSNRIANGKFSFEGRQISVPLNAPGEPHALHGHGWQSGWDVEKSEKSLCVLSLTRNADNAWPFSYRAVQTMRLAPGSLDLELHLENRGTGNMPCGLGFHPYFPRPKGTRLQATVGRVWLGDENVLPTERIAVPAKWDLTRGLLLDTPVLDNCFDGFGGEARIFYSDREKPTLLTSPEATHLIVYCPKDEAFVCAEPTTHMPDAFNRAAAGWDATGHRVLGPGEEISLTMRLSLGEA
ncbi:MAG: aldose 1-epimerase [Rhizomicrobium sp.]